MENNIDYRLPNNLSFRNIITLLIVIVCVFNSISQNKTNKRYCFVAGVGIHLSGNSVGGIYDLYGNMYKKNNITSIGLCIQGRTKMPCGMRIGYSRILTGKDKILFVENEKIEEIEEIDELEVINEKLQLYFYSYLQYTYNTPLSYVASQTEVDNSISKNDMLKNYSNSRLSTVEACFGFGLNVKLNKIIVWSNYIGLSNHYYTNYVNGMYIDKCALGIALGTTLGFKIN